MDLDAKIHLTSSESSSLWQGYMVDGLASCILKHFLNTVEDKEIAPVVEYALNRSQNHLQTINHKVLAMPKKKQ